tara:strand:+ start:677 stop:835 length:159 start_codon:yes stop_codon:yes gene_type:complete
VGILEAAEASLEQVLPQVGEVLASKGLSQNVGNHFLGGLVAEPNVTVQDALL